MVFTVTQAEFDESAATAQIEARGWHAITFNAPAETTDWHWHDFDAVIYVLEGSARIELQDGSEVFACGAGVVVDAPHEIVHREITDGYRAVFGLSVPVTELTEPINKPISLLVREPAPSQ